MSTENTYKDTVNLPKTEFPMKANLPQREPEMIANWNQIGLYEKILKKNEGGKTFAMPDGPPYANGHLHMGHALNKILKDIVIKFKGLSGYYAPFIPGWDCHGLPIEHGVLKNLGPKRAEKSEVEVRELCRQEAKKWVGVQREQFIRYGILGDWENPYLTLDPAYEADEVRTLAKILDKGIFYRGEKPVYWCLPLQTALAEAEVEYHDHKSPAVYVKFDLKNAPVKGKAGIVIWTTTPWTLPANLAVSVHPEFDYEFFETNGESILIAQKLKDAFEADTGLSLKSSGIVKRGEDLVGLEYEPVIPSAASRTLKSKHKNIWTIISGDHVTSDAGTGCVHTAPGHGQDDYSVGLKFDVPVFSPVNEAGKYSADIPEYEGQKVFDANPLIVERLKKEGHLLGFKEIVHSYPHCWRTKTPLIFRATPQWFIRMDDEKNSLRSQALNSIKNVQWVPSWGENRITGMIANRPDWCLSRQRLWGVPIPVFYCQKCNTELTSSKIMNHVADLMEKDGGIEAYHKHSTKELLGGEAQCKKCHHTEFNKGKDILDVWFDSGVCFAAVQNRRRGLTTPADLYLEGSDQHRGWFHTSLLASLAATDKPPFKTVLTHGFVMFAKGQKMSKSLGNVVDPRDIIKDSGAEVLRLWAAHEDYAQDLTCTPESFQRVTETYRRMRNTMRFLLGNIGDFNPDTDLKKHADLMPIDQWCLAKLNQLIENTEKAYTNYEFYKVYHLLNNFVTTELSAVYLDVLKDRLYTWKQNGAPRRAAQTVLYHVLHTLSGLMAPILTFLADETYAHIPGKKLESIFLTNFPQKNLQWENVELIATFEALLEVRSDVSKFLEELRQSKTIGASLEAEIEISAENEKWKALEGLGKDLRTFFIVSKADLKKGPYKVHAIKSNGKKCVRCWHYYDPKQESAQFADVCPKCVEALS